MEVRAFDVDGIHFFVPDEDGSWVSVGIGLAMKKRPARVAVAAIRVHDYTIAGQRFWRANSGDERDQTVLDFVRLPLHV